MRDRRGEFLFIDARKLGRMEGRVNRVFDDADIEKIAQAVHAWRHSFSPRPQAGEGLGERVYADEPGFCASVKLGTIAEHGYVLTPGRYVGAEDVEDDDEVFADKMAMLTSKLSEQMAKGIELDKLIRTKLASLGYAV